MSDANDLFQFYYSQHDKYSFRTSWHTQKIIEDVLDLGAFIYSISTRLEPDELLKPYEVPFGYFQVGQPSRIKYTHIIFLFSILERRMRALIQLIIELKPIGTKDLIDYKGSFFEQVKAFLKETIGVEVGESKSWNEIMVLQKVRDCIIHCGANINESRDKIYLSQLVTRELLNCHPIIIS